MKVDDRRAHGPNPAMCAMARRGAQNRAAPFFPPTALRRTVPPQQGGARVFLTTRWTRCCGSLPSLRSGTSSSRRCVATDDRGTRRA